jgi:Ca-activated chloride channel family protein
MARSAGHVFLGALRPADRAAVVAIGSTVETVAPLSADRPAQHAALTSVTAWGTTALHDAILVSIDAVQPASGRRALVLLSDGDDRYSEHAPEAVLARARETDVLVYPVALGDAMPPLFGQLAGLTGGRAFHVRRPAALSPTLQAIADELRGQYLLGYVPTPSEPDAEREWRSIDVCVKREGLRVRARKGYFGGRAR